MGAGILALIRSIVLVAVLVGGCTSAASQRTTSPSPSSGCRPGPPEAGVYQPDRLQVLAPCRHANGVVVSVVPEEDGDYHVWIRLDPGFDDLLNAENHFELQPTLLAEIVPDCPADAAPPDAPGAKKCPPSKLTIPVAGQHIGIDGPWVLDRNHGWNEIHPVDAIAILSPT